MDIDTTQTDNTCILRPKGIINIQSSPELRTLLLKLFGDGSGRCIMNLAEVSYMDSSGLATLVEGLQIAQEGGGSFALCSIEQPMLKDLLEMTHLTSAFPTFKNEEEALAQ